MSVDREKRIRIAKQLLSLGPDVLRPNPHFRKILKIYANQGTLGRNIPEPFRETIYQFEEADLDTLPMKEARRIAGTGYISIMDMLLGVPDDEEDLLQSSETSKKSSRWLIPLVFLGLFLFMAGVMGLILMLLVGQSELSQAFFETDSGQTLLATIAVMSIVGSALGWFRRQVGVFSLLIRLVLMVTLAGGVLFFVLQIAQINTDFGGTSAQVQTATQSDNNQLLMAGVFIISILTSIFLLIRRMVMNMIWFFVFLVLVVLILIMAGKSGMIELGGLFNGSETTVIAP